ncbi:MAG: GTPase Era [Acidobacteriota bacterium]
MKKCGFVALIGRPNSGKSTLLNRLMGQKVSIVSDKPQTTRKRILGVLTSDETQLIFVDTPGIHKPGHQLNRRMMAAVYEAVREVDLLLHMVDASESYGKGEEFAMRLVKQSGKPSLLLLNKVDSINKGKVLPQIEAWSERSSYLEIIPLSALKGDNVDVLMKKIAENLPQGEFHYPEDYWTDQQEREMAAEIVREKVLARTRKELPYTSAVSIDSFDSSRREEGFIHISATIVVERLGQKKIVIGKGARMIKAIGTEARKELQRLLNVPRLYLELNVKVVPGWRDRQHLLTQLGVQ